MPAGPWSPSLYRLPLSWLPLASVPLFVPMFVVSALPSVGPGFVLGCHGATSDPWSCVANRLQYHMSHPRALGLSPRCWGSHWPEVHVRPGRLRAGGRRSDGGPAGPRHQGCEQDGSSRKAAGLRSDPAIPAPRWPIAPTGSWLSEDSAQGASGSDRPVVES